MVRNTGGGPFSASHDALVGRYTYHHETDTWTWSDEMYRIHGFEPGEVVPTAELVMRHVHPEDRAAAWESREAVVEQRRPFTFLHRIVTAKNRERVVIAAGHLEHEADGTPFVAGHLVDLTDIRRDAVDAQLDTAASDFADHRAAIEQAKGVLVQLYSVDPDTAFALLRAFSMDANRKVRDVAAALVAAAGQDLTPTKEGPPSAHDVLEQVLDAPSRVDARVWKDAQSEHGSSRSRAPGL